MDAQAVFTFFLLGVISAAATDLTIETNVVTLVDLHGTITSPNYPANYHDDYEGIWELNIPPMGGKYTFALNIEAMDIEGSPGHCIDYIKINHNEYCGQSPMTIRVQDIEYGVVIDFRTDISITGKGFTATYVFEPQY